MLATLHSFSLYSISSFFTPDEPLCPRNGACETFRSNETLETPLFYDHPRASPFSEFKEELKGTCEVASNAWLNARRD